MEASTDGLRLLYVPFHLRDQIVDRVEPFLAAQPFDEGDPEDPAIQIDLLVDDVGLDQDSPTGVKVGLTPMFTAAGRPSAKAA